MDSLYKLVLGFSLFFHFQIQGAAKLEFLESESEFDYGTVEDAQILHKTFHLTNKGDKPAHSISSQPFQAKLLMKKLANGDTEARLKLLGKQKLTRDLEPYLDNSFDFKGGKYPGEGGNCGQELGVGQSCTLVVSFTPRKTDQSASEWTLTYFDGDGTAQINGRLMGYLSEPPHLTLRKMESAKERAMASNLPLLEFEDVPLTKSSEMTLILRNEGEAPAKQLKIGFLRNDVFGFVGGHYPGLGGNCGKELNGNSECQLKVHFKPTELGAASDSLQMSYSGSARNFALDKELIGTAIGKDGKTRKSLEYKSESLMESNVDLAHLTIELVGAQNLEESESGTLSLSPIEINQVIQGRFRIVNSSRRVASNIRFLGFRNDVFSFLGGMFPGMGGNCKSELAPDSSCEVVLAFSPTQPGYVFDTITIVYFNGRFDSMLMQSISAEGVLKSGPRMS